MITRLPKTTQSGLLSLILLPIILLSQIASAGDTTNTQFVSTPTATPTNLRASTSVGCFASSTPMIDHGPHIYQSSGNCQRICYLFGNNVMGLGNGTDCWCGDVLPAKDSKVDDGQCNTPCAGFDQENCGSGTTWSVFLTGYTLNQVPYYDAASASKSAASSKATSSKSSTATPKKSSSPVGIVVGVIVAVVIVAILTGAGVLLYRRRQQRSISEIKEQNTGPSSGFSSGGASGDTRPSMWAPDTRLDNAAGRRISSGSIADNEDFSRRLEVRNPDGF